MLLQFWSAGPDGVVEENVPSMVSVCFQTGAQTCRKTHESCKRSALFQRSLLAGHGERSSLERAVRFFALLALISVPLLAADRFTGVQSCASSGCHGGGKGDDQLLVWMKKDPHSQASSRLTSQFSMQIGKALGIADPTKSEQCTVCHSPMQSAAPERLAHNLKPNLGVSCEVCHAPAEKWIRFHTRTDVSHAQRVAAGMRDLEKPAQRADTCAGCHLHLPNAVRAAGHRELQFELATQLAGLPPHWAGDTPMDAPRAWLAGQAVSLRELAWREQKTPDAGVSSRIAAILWLLHQTEAGKAMLPAKENDLSEVRAAANRLAVSAAKSQWTPASTRAQIVRLCENAAQFRDAALDPITARRRAEALVLAVHALALPLRRDVKFDAQIIELKGQIRSSVSFEPATFAGLLEGVPTLLP